ncbi:MULTISPECIES: PTS mannitol transporter subunit IICBA [Pectobacterium]|jgi:PTS system mannitol-specific IIC component|uniref:PTS system mannitol-specific EIICBA component n=1 Tax=Pectobacterium carotovorum subsp. carotovorum (strain PC1) TaxID=561230 RepID=C6DII5_PECCP|nr:MULTISPECIES: PTS mannitol transporter subunit IICBA [Pectobacterium]ACT15179.1 PTS system, mannitol-specific IIC subunit [Pectobacterium carotovorum subsp. carotovorum PC1]MBA0205895.1 PTS mannitol transporter subunit IICBA [Pectobacterium aroidearum]MBA5237454.1 PTS mannitol transporter subunit IICBA [Pectobacterium aroidearum]MBA5602916.1 PTS mannitol transporter subunit IICBA [Pectobacterium aroidearum]MBG0753491.1 PTS system mannitol-specific EIICBA component [Pectobacterium carotovoru
MLSPDIKIKVQNFGRFLSNMVMPNIGAFIAWGIITALFIPTGWIPNETLAKLVGPMITYLLPLLIGYTGGRLVFGERGGVVGAITTMGVIVGTDIPMFLGAMIVGPLGGWAIKRFDRVVDGKIKSGFEMLVNNFSAGIIGMLLAILAFLAIGPLVEVFSQVLASGVNLMVQNNLLPFTSIFVEPAKILFLNNAINHGIFSPLGIQQATETGKSIFFLIEANPGPGMGVLMAYMFFGRGNAKESAPGAAIIHFLGGIHEIYFPYVLMNPRLIIAVILGGMTGVFTLSVLGGGLVSPASPGSILAVLAMTPKGAYFANLAAIAAAFAVSFIVSAILLKSTKQKEEDLSDATRRVQEMKASAKGTAASAGVSGDMSTVRKIIVACDAGMGSSAMGAGVLRKKVQDAGLTNISVTNSAINSLPDDVDLVITHRDLTERAMRHAPQAQHISLTNFLDSGLYSDLAARLVAAQGAAKPETVATPAPAVADTQTNLFQLGAGNVFLNQHATHKEQAIRFAGEQLVKGGYVEPEYVEAMLEREKLTSTYLGESIAVPHGTIEAKDRVLKTGVVFCQYPEGVRFGDEEDEVARLVIGIAARNNEHIQVITSLTNALDDDAVIERLAHTQDVQEVLDLLSGKKSA